MLSQSSNVPNYNEDLLCWTLRMLYHRRTERASMTRRLSKPIRIALASLGCVALLFVAAFGLLTTLFGNPWDIYPFDNSSFNRAVWFEDATLDCGGNRRAGMVEDILQRSLNHRMTRQQVVDLLGKPESEFDNTMIAGDSGGRFTPEDKHAHHILVYYLGEELGGVDHGRWIDRAWLDLHFDASGHFTEGKTFVPH